MQNIKKRLVEKGWAKSEINKALKIIEKARENKHPKIKILDKSVYWISLFVALLGNIVISISLIPALLALNPFQLVFVVLTLGISFGLLFELLIRTIDLKTRYHILLSILMPLMALANIAAIVIVSNKLEGIIKVQNPQNPVFIGVIYAVAFMLPYFIYRLFLKDKL